VTACTLLLLAAPAAAQTETDEAETDEAETAAEEEPPPPDGEVPVLPAPTLEEEEPVAPAEPLPAAPEEEDERPQILEHIGTGDHPEWEDEDEDGELPRDYAIEVPDDQRSNNNTPENPQNPQVMGVDEEQEVPPFHLGVGGGWSRLLAGVPLGLSL